MKISKFIKLQAGAQTITVNILPKHILKSKDNQMMKFSQSIEYNVRNIFLQKHAEN